jgi:hypothetical protein
MESVGLVHVALLEQVLGADLGFSGHWQLTGRGDPGAVSPESSEAGPRTVPSGSGQQASWIYSGKSQ